MPRDRQRHGSRASPRRAFGRLALVTALLTTVLLTWSDPSKRAAAPETGTTAHRGDGAPHLIKHGWDIPEVSFVARHAVGMRQMPFDGVVMQLDDGLSMAVQRQDPVSYETFRQALEPLAGADLTDMDRNFLMVYSTPAGDVFDDWSVPISNYTNLSRAARDAGFEGIFFDNEEYFGPALGERENCGGNRSEDRCRLRAFHLGSRVMNAIRSGWPEAQVLIAHGPYIGDERTAEYLNARGMPFNDIAWANRLRGAFAVGMASATFGTDAQFIDGGEVYSARTPQNFADLKQWQKVGFAAQGSLVPDRLVPQWEDGTSAAFGVYDSAGGSRPMDPHVWESTLHNALRTTDCYVWAYTEKHDWWGTGHPAAPVPADWVDATRQARERSADPTSPLGPHAQC